VTPPAGLECEGQSIEGRLQDLLFRTLIAASTVGKLLAMLQAAKATNAYDRKLSALAKTDLLIIDDFWLKPFKSSEDEDFYDLIAERYERVSTVITSNLDFAEWGEAFNDKLLGAATLDRIRHGAYKGILEGRSYRSSREEAALKNRVAGAEENT